MTIDTTGARLREVYVMPPHHRDAYVELATASGTIVAQLHRQRDAVAIEALGGEPEPRYTVDVDLSLTEIAELHSWLGTGPGGPTGLADRLSAALAATWKQLQGSTDDLPTQTP